MAIVKSESFKGAFPHWWEIQKVEKLDFHNTSLATFSLFHSYEAYKQDALGNILYDVAVQVPGINLSNEYITAWVVANSPRFKNGIDTGTSQYVTIEQSSVFIHDPNLDPKNGLKRSIEGIYYTEYLNVNMIVLSLRVHYYPKIQVPNPDFVPTYDENDVLLNPEQQFVEQFATDYDPKLDRNIPLVVDNFYEYADGVGELDFFKTLRSQGQTTEQILSLGIMYGLQKGYIDRHL
jgi:hypothetical protein